MAGNRVIFGSLRAMCSYRKYCICCSYAASAGKILPRSSARFITPPAEPVCGPACAVLRMGGQALPYADLLAKLNSRGWRTRLLRLSHRPEETKKAFHSRNLESIVDTLIDAH